MLCSQLRKGRGGLQSEPQQAYLALWSFADIEGCLSLTLFSQRALCTLCAWVYIHTYAVYCNDHTTGEAA